MRHVDALHEAEELEQRRDRGAASEDEADASAASQARSGGTNGVVPLNVSLRSDGSARQSAASQQRYNAPGAPYDTVVSQRDAEAERWVNLRWEDAADRSALLARSHEPLPNATCATDYL